MAKGFTTYKDNPAEAEKYLLSKGYSVNGPATKPGKFVYIKEEEDSVKTAVVTTHTKGAKVVITTEEKA